MSIMTVLAFSKTSHQCVLRPKRSNCESLVLAPESHIKLTRL